MASTHNDHVGSARLCLEAGKAVLVEKPLTVSAAETEELVDLAGERGVFLMEALWSRTNPLLRQAAQLVHAGDWGHPARDRLVRLRLRWRPDPSAARPRSGRRSYPRPRCLPRARRQPVPRRTGRAVRLRHSAPTGVEAHAAALLTYDSTESRPPATASVACTLEADLPSRLEVFCTDGSIRLDNFLLPSEMTVIRGTGDDKEEETLVTQWPGGGYTFEIGEVNRCLRAGELESPLVPWRDTLAVARTLDRWLLSVFPPLDPELRD